MTQKIRVAILDDYTHSALELADWATIVPEAELTVFDAPIVSSVQAQVLEPFEVIVAMRERMPLPGELLEQLPNLRLLVTTGMRNLSIDLAATERLGIVVAGTTGKAGTTVELTWALILALLRDIPGNDARMRTGSWQISPGGDVGGEVLGVLGLGRLGTQVAKIGLAFGMKVLACDPRLTAERAAEIGVEPVCQLELFRRSRVVTLHVLLTPATRGLVGWSDLEALGSDSYLVNAARSGLVDAEALRQALETGAIAGAALDVYDEEPLPADAWIRTAPRTILSPHLGYVSKENFRVFYTEAAQDIRGWLDGDTPRVLFNKRRA